MSGTEAKAIYVSLPLGGAADLGADDIMTAIHSRLIELDNDRGPALLHLLIDNCRDLLRHNYSQPGSAASSDSSDDDGDYHDDD